MQTEMMLRLLAKDSKSPSGYKVVGYMKTYLPSGQNGMVIKVSVKPTDEDVEWWEVAPYMADDYQDWIRHNASELGIKVGDEWFFEGDLFRDSFTGIVWELVYKGDSGWWMHEYSDERIFEPEPFYDTFIDRDGSLNDNLDLIGNIHEQPSIRKSQDIQNGDET